MDRFFAPPSDWGDSEVLVRGGEARHCLQVMRKGRGDEIEVFDGNGRWMRGVIGGADHRAVAVEVGERGENVRNATRIHLCVAVPKGKTMDLIVQKAVELGVAGIRPLVTERTVVRLAAPDAKRRHRKWQRVALEACKQCGQNTLPVITAPEAFEAWIRRRDRSVAGFLASLRDGARPFRSALKAFAAPPAELEMLIGPEGDFSDRETERALEVGLHPVSLGDLVMRVETAALFSLSVLNYELRRAAGV